MSGNCPHCGEHAGHLTGCIYAWIACADRLPDDDEAVIVCLDGDVWAAYHCAGAWHTLDGVRMRYATITHWQPMPEPPACYLEESA